MIEGHLDLVCAAGPDGVSYLKRQSFSAPFHISKPHLDADALVVNLANPTAGWFSGDRVTSRVEVEPGARLLLTTPSASRAHRMPEGEAHLEQTFVVRASGFLEVLPELFIPQRGARFRQRTRIELEPGATLLFWESLAPGRVASGEVFSFTSLEWETDLVLGGQLILREKYALRPDDLSLKSLQTHYGAAYYATLLFVGHELPPCELPSDQEFCFGMSKLVRGGAVGKLLAPYSLGLRKGLKFLRQSIYQSLGQPVPDLRRGW